MAQQAPLTIYESARLEALKSRSALRLLLVTMRPHQWVKNLFILTPLLFGKKLGDSMAIGQALTACAVFCLMSSSLYIFNDVIDAREDRAHPEKRFRPISSGALTVPVALVGSVVLLTAAFWIAAAALSPKFILVAALYFGLTLCYCVALKRTIILDGMIIASGFVLRVVGGAVAVGVMPTHWLIVCSFLLALFLAFAKRRQELLMLSDAAAEHRQVLGQYTVSYLEQVNNILIGATIVCYALYTVAPETIARFGTNHLIYGTVFVMYGLLRYMALIRNPTRGGNPSKMLLEDKPLLLAVLGWAIYNALVIYHSPIVALYDAWR